MGKARLVKVPRAYLECALNDPLNTVQQIVLIIQFSLLSLAMANRDTSEALQNSATKQKLAP